MSKFFALILLFILITASYADLPYYPLVFPRDEAAHFANVPYTFKQLMEWWYFNGKGTTDDGKHISFDVAFFNPVIINQTVYNKPMLHIQIADLDNKKSYGAANVYSANSGQISTSILDISVDRDYFLKKTTLNGKDFYILKAKAQTQDTSIKLNLILKPSSPVFLINRNGLMSMPNETNSYYYSIPKFEVVGTIFINNAAYRINHSPGTAWMDHQWGDFDVRKNGWEWFSIRLENGLIANIFLNIEYKNNKVIGGLANIILPSGETKFIDYKDFKVSRNDYWFDQKLSISYPLSFHLEFPSLGLEINNIAAFPEQEILGYWEGYCHVNAYYKNEPVSGFSYMELVYKN